MTHVLQCYSKIQDEIKFYVHLYVLTCILFAASFVENNLVWKLLLLGSCLRNYLQRLRHFFLYHNVSLAMPLYRIS